MRLRYPLAVLAAALLVAGAVRWTQPRAAGARAAAAAVAEESPAALLERYGEPALAWDVLRRNGGPRNESDQRLAIRLLTELGRYAEADSLLARSVIPRDSDEAFLLRLQRARLNHAARRDGRALVLLATEPAPDAALEAYRLVMLARVQRALGEPAAAAANLERIDDASAPLALRGELARDRIAVYRELGRPRDAMVTAARAAARADDAATARAMLLVRYEAARETGESTEAVRAAQDLLSAHAASPEAGQVAADLAGRAGRGVPSATLLACAQSLSLRNDAPALRGALRALDARALSGRDAEAHRLLWAEYHYQSGDYSRAIALARPSYADPDLRRRSMLVMARSLRKLGKRSEAGAVYEQLVRDYPNDRLAAEALYAAASLYEDDGRAAESARVLDQLRRSYPSSFHGWAAAMQRAGDLSHGGDSAAAVAIYEQWLARSRRSDEAALYYLARERERAAPGSGGMIMDELRALNRYSFYVLPDVAASVRGPLRDSSGGMVRGGAGSLAEWLTRAEADRTDAYRRVLHAVAAPPAADTDADRALARGMFFLDAGLRDWAEGELDAARRLGAASPGASLRLARLYDEYAMPWRSVRLYERARSALPWQERRSHSEDFRVLTYPLPYPAQVLESAARNGIPPHLIYGMIREESRFEADVVSRAGAVGLMQLMPHTARRVAAQLDLAQEIDERLDEPAVNVSLGVWYAADLLRAGDGSVAWMLAAYNAGPGAAERWLAPGVSGEPSIDAVESIHYKETRGYVKRVVESANVYHALYFAGSPR